MTALLAYTPLIAVAAAIVAAVMGFENALLALRAKQRLRVVLAERAGRDHEVRRLMELAARRRLDKFETEVARNVIEASAQQLPEEDRRLLEKGLHQTSTSGEQRFIGDLLSASASSCGRGKDRTDLATEAAATHDNSERLDPAGRGP